MKTLDVREADRLAKLLGMLGSAHAGERANAGVAAEKFCAPAGWSGRTWSGTRHRPGQRQITAAGCRPALRPGIG
jgi:hypothetical protein